jgi:hypothetical protein
MSITRRSAAAALQLFDAFKQKTFDRLYQEYNITFFYHRPIKAGGTKAGYYQKRIPKTYRSSELVYLDILLTA